MNDPRYPVGRFERPENITPDQRQAWMGILAALPGQLKNWVASAPASALDVPYREGGWTARQVIHHLADSHLNSYIRFRLALTEDRPTIKPYDEAAWATLSDAATGPVEPSLEVLDGIHYRLVRLLEGLTEDQWKREFIHPERGVVDLPTTLAMYAWHSRHHLAHLSLIHQ